MKFRTKSRTEFRNEENCRKVITLSIIVEPVEKICVIKDDPDDDKFIE